jgi:hypothetical protein
MWGHQKVNTLLVYRRDSGPGLLDKKAEEDAAFCLIKDGTFFHLFCPTNPLLNYL